MLLAVLALSVMSLAAPAHRGEAADGLWQPLRHILSDNPSRQTHVAVERQDAPAALPPVVRTAPPEPTLTGSARIALPAHVASGRPYRPGQPRGPPVA